MVAYVIAPGTDPLYPWAIYEVNLETCKMTLIDETTDPQAEDVRDTYGPNLLILTEV